MTPNARYIFFGTPEFASAILEKLIESGFMPDAVVCNPDRPVGRKKIMTPPPVKILAQKHGVRILQPENLSASDLKSRDSFDFFVVAAYAKIIPVEILKLPRLGTIGVHPSLLPKYRGSSPIQSVLLGGDKETGVTLYLLDEKMDHGPIISQKACPISHKDTYSSLLAKLAEIGGELIVETLPNFVSGEIHSGPQDENEATYTKKFKTEDGFVENAILENAEKTGNAADIIDKKIRALNPEPGVWTMRNGKRIKILEAEVKDGKLIIKTMQEEGGKPRPYKEN